MMLTRACVITHVSRAVDFMLVASSCSIYARIYAVIYARAFFIILSPAFINIFFVVLTCHQLVVDGFDQHFQGIVHCTKKCSQLTSATSMIFWEKKTWECWECLGMLVVKRECFLCPVLKEPCRSKCGPNYQSYIYHVL